MARSHALRVGPVGSYAGGSALVASMLLGWPWIGRRGHLSGLEMISRLRRASTRLDLPYATEATIVWFALPLCGAAVMVLAAHGTAWARRAAAALSAVALAEALLLAMLYRRQRLDPWAGNGLLLAVVGALLATAGTVVSLFGQPRPATAVASSALGGVDEQ